MYVSGDCAGPLRSSQRRSQGGNESGCNVFNVVETGDLLS